MEQRKNSSGFNLFLFGILVGVLATLLLTTKKGRKILKTLLDEGLEKFSKLEDVIGRVEEEMEDDGFIEEEPVKPAKAKDVVKAVTENIHERVEQVEEAVENVVSKIEKMEIDEPVKKRRLFKGIRRKAS